MDINGLASSSLVVLPILGAVTSARWRILARTCHVRRDRSRKVTITFLLEVGPADRGGLARRGCHRRWRLSAMHQSYERGGV